jgi:hypothetical protein
MSAVSLTVDYSNGVSKHFSTIPCGTDLTVLAAIEAAAKIAPGLVVDSASDRSGHAMNLAIDQLPLKEGAKAEWLLWINAKPFKARLGTETSFKFHPDEREANLVRPGDHILLKLVVAEDDV